MKGTMHDFTDQLDARDAIEVYLIRATDTTLIEGIIAGEDRAYRFAVLINEYLGVIEKRPRQRCVSCARPLNRCPPAVIIMLPFGKDWEAERLCASVSGVCERCNRRPDDELMRTAAELVGGNVERFEATKH